MIGFLRLSLPVLIVAPLLMWRWISLLRLPATAPVWLTVTVAGLAAYGAGSAFFIERQCLKDPTATRLRAKGRIPEQAVAIIGVVSMLSPASWAFLAAFIGLSATQLGYYAGVSTLGVAFWGWRYRRVFYAA